VQRQITKHLNNLRLHSQPIYPLNQRPRNTSPPAYQLNPHPVQPTTTSPFIHQDTLFNPAPTFKGVYNQLRSTIGTVARERESAQFNRKPAQLNTQLDQDDDQTYKEVYDQH
jgi:hypothetical protein